MKLANVVEEPILHVVARQAFFALPKTRIVDYIEHEGLPKPTCDSLFDTVFAAVKGILGLTDNEVMTIMKVRFSRLPCHTEYLGGLLAVDEAQACLDARDREELTRVQVAAKDSHTERQEFVRSFKAQRERMTSSTSSGPAKRAGTSGVSSYKVPKRLPAPGREGLLQKDLRQFTPPGGHFWVARTISAWWTRLPPMAQHTAYWKHFESEEAAARSALQNVWRVYLETEGLGACACPITNLGLTPSPSSSAASSST